jgi:RHS repeat-associated protein
VPFTATYTSFGSVSGTGLYWMPFGFAGGIYDSDSGLVRFGSRDFDPETGRWIAKDPLRFSSGQQNIYLYGADDPINRRDPTGLKDIAKCAATMFGCRLVCPEGYTPVTFTACALCLAKWAWDCKDMDLDDEPPVNNCPPGQHPGDWFESPCMPDRPEDPGKNSCDLRPDCDPSTTSCLP